jgi:hypothetical protein
MNATQLGIVDELRSNARSLAQLASWQLALVRDMESKLATLESATGDRGGRPEAKVAKGRAGRRR